MADTPQGTVNHVLIEDELKTSYLTYAMSVIVKRALPDARDGLKPSQRRILLAMHDLGQPRAGFRKCAKINGDTAGNYHPHGDQVVYPTLVRMGQEWNMRYLLVAKQGNFGSIDGDDPAAARYTEANLDLAAVEMLTNLNDDTVTFIPNYDQTRREPTVLPGRFPNLVCNGASGIAVGMRTEMPPHNYSEVANALHALLDNPDISIDEICKHIKGPDFPYGGIVLAEEGLRDAYHTGRGQIRLRARCVIEECDERKGCEMIVVTEFPYQVSKLAIVEKITDLAATDRVKGIADIDDQSGRQFPRGRLVIRIKKGENARVILNRLYKYSQLQKTYSYNMIALIPPQIDINSLEPPVRDEAERNLPQLLNIKQLLEIYRDHRYIVIRRRTYKALVEARTRRHILQGLIKALDHIDEIIKLIRGSANTLDARINLMREYAFSEPQANHILEMPLRRLTGLERQRLQDELDEKTGEIEEYESILGDAKRVYAIIREELDDMRKRFGDPRRTEILLGGDGGELTRAMTEKDEEVAVTVTSTGYIKRVSLQTYRKQARGGVGVKGGEVKEEDEETVEHLFTTSTHQKLLVFTTLGRMFLLPVWDIPEMSRTAKGRYIANLEGIEMKPDESIAAIYQVTELTAEDPRHVVMATRNGTVKKTALSDFVNVTRRGIKAIRLRDGDALIGVRLATHEDVILGTKLGFSIRFPAEDTEAPIVNEDGEAELDENGEPRIRTITGLRALGRDTQGVRGITLRDGDEVVDMILVSEKEEQSDLIDILTICENGYGKRTPIREYRRQSRGGKGIINIKASARNGSVVALKDVYAEDQLLLISTSGKTQRLAVGEVRRTETRAAQGVRVQTLNEGEHISAVTRVPKDAAARGTRVEEGGTEAEVGVEGADSNGQDNPANGGAGRKSSRAKSAKPLTDDELLDSTDDDLKNIDAALDQHDEKYSKRKKPVEDEDESDDDE